jgi:hypothetical protein
LIPTPTCVKSLPVIGALDDASTTIGKELGVASTVIGGIAPKKIKRKELDGGVSLVNK